MTQGQRRANGQQPEVFDYVVIGSGFGGSVSAMRLTQKGYKVLVLERGKRYDDEDFARTDWNFRKLFWVPALRCFGIWQWTFLNGALIQHGSGVGGGSLVYSNVLEEPDDRLFDAPGWRQLADWKAILRPHYEAARRMLGVTANPHLWPADEALREVAQELGNGHSFRPTQVGVFFNDNGQAGDLVPDPYFGGEGPSRRGCIDCGGCIMGCRYNAKNTLVKNYLYFAEKWGAAIWPEARVTDIRPLSDGQPDGARYEVEYQRSTAWLRRPTRRVRTRNVLVSAGALGTIRLLLRCRDVTGSLPDLSPRLGEWVRTNSEELTAATARGKEIDYSKGLSITSVFKADEVTHIEPVRLPEGSSFLAKVLGAPLISGGDNVLVRLLKFVWEIVRHPLDFLHYKFFPHWARRGTILLIMQSEDNSMRLKLGRNLFTLMRLDLVSEKDRERPIQAELKIGHRVTRMFAEKIGGTFGTLVNESLLNIPSTAHIMGGCSFGQDAEEGVIGLDCQVHNYPGLYVVDGSIMPANPGINPSLTIAALAEYAMSHVPAQAGHVPHALPLGSAASEIAEQASPLR